MTRVCFLLIVIFLSGWINREVVAETRTLVSSGSEWRYFKGTREPGVGFNYWKSLAYDDSNWDCGASPIYYGGGISDGTQLADMKGNYSSVYFRKTFFLEDGNYTSLKLRVLCDDGCIVWLNGREILRFNTPEGDLAYDAVASELITSASWKEYDISDFISVLWENENNILAIHGLNVSLDNSSDFVLDMELEAESINDWQPPRIAEILPEEGTFVGNPPSVSVIFNEPVKGVKSDDLFCNGVSAREVRQINEMWYQFDFDVQEEGSSLQFEWNPEAEICDLSGLDNQFIPDVNPWWCEVHSGKGRGSVIISEIMTDNDSTLKTWNGMYEDWIELYNPGIAAVDLSGWYLTDSKGDLTCWQFPEGTELGAGECMIVFCDGTEGQPYINREYHANFSLNKEGEYLALVYKDGETIIHEFAPVYPELRTDCSYGIGGFYYLDPSPGQVNGIGLYAPVGEIQFSEPRGYKDSPFTLTLSTADEGARIYYTLDGTVPSKENGQLYREPLYIDRITCLRAIAIKEGHLDSEVVTRTWLFLEEVLTQSASTPEGWPASYAVNGHKMEYGMNPAIVNSSKYSEDIRKGFMSIDTISMVTDLKNLFDPTIGIYVNPSGSGEDWERPASLELIDPDGGEEFQLESGIRLRGSASRTASNPKHSFRFFFRSRYGGTLKFPLFGEEGDLEFDKVDLRTSQNYSWAYEITPYDTFIRETFARDSQRDVGMPYTRSRYYHLFINGQYWGLYQTQERSETSYAETYLGGNKEDWDLLKTESSNRNTVVSEGTDEASYELHRITIEEGFAGDYATNYWRIKGLNPDGTYNANLPCYLDEKNLQEYMLNVYMTSDTDSPISVWGGFANNIFGLYNRVNPSGFKWFRHDGEHCLGGRRYLGYGEAFDLVACGWDYNDFIRFNPMRLHQRLMDHPDYRMNFIDLIQKRVLNEDGEFTVEANRARWKKRQEELVTPIVAESARWGHGYTREDWYKECDYVLNTFFTEHPAYLMTQLKAYGWFSSLDAPEFSRTGGEMPSAENPVVLSGRGKIYCTTDGSDPRLIGGELNPEAILLDMGDTDVVTLIPKGASWKYYDAGQAPERLNGTSWYLARYDDSDWHSGIGTLGFGGKENTTVASLGAETGEAVNTVYFRYSFDLGDLSLSSLKLNLRCDDGAVVYLNGGIILRLNMPDSSQYSTPAESEVTGLNEDEYQTFVFSPQNLNQRNNLLAVEVHQSSEKGDLYFDLSLEGEGMNSSGEISFINLPNEQLSNLEGVLLRARAYNGVEWSAIAEADFSLPGDIHDLRVTEMMYSPVLTPEAENRGWNRDDLAWLELRNIGEGVLNLNGVRFGSGIDYTFGEVILRAGEHLILAKNREAFLFANGSSYDLGVQLLDGYSGNLARKGELISLLSADGESILSYTYSNQWYPETDQGGYSLVVVDPRSEEALWSTEQNWRPSANLGGSPGMMESVIDCKLENFVFLPDGKLSFGIGELSEVFEIEVSNDLKNWILFENWNVENGQVILDLTGTEGEDALFFRLKL